MKLYKKYGTAKKAANGQPIMHVSGAGYLVGGISAMTEVKLITPSGRIEGHVIMRHLVRLGNGNHAEKGTGRKTTFPGEYHAWERAMGMAGYVGSPAEAEDRKAA